MSLIKVVLKTLLWMIVTSVIFLSLSCKSEKENAKEEGRSPNVVIIFTDDQGYGDVGCFGATDILTPHIDGLAKRGVKLTDFSVAQPVCSASRAALLTGCYPNRLGIHGALMPLNTHGINQEETTMAEMLKAKGYATAAFGKWHLGNMGPFSPLKHGFDEYFGIPYSNDMWPSHPWQGTIFDFPPLPLYENDTPIDSLEDQSNLTTQITEKAVDFIKRNKQSPFFLYVPHPQPHVPLYVSDKFKGKSERGLYGDVIMELDWSVGEIVKTLESEGLTKNTIVIFTSDNGPWLSYGTHSGSAQPLREGKGTAWEGGVREPFVISYPGVLPEGKTVATHVMSIDILPTIAHVTGAELPSLKIDGVNAWDVFMGTSTQSTHDAYYYYYATNELWAVRQGDWKMYFPHKYRTLNGKEGGANGAPTQYEHNTLEEPELYNLTNDVSETNNVFSQNPDIVKSLSALADAKRLELGDSFHEIEGSGMREAGVME